MTREEAKMWAELYSALADGKTVQIISSNGTWEDIEIEKLSKIYDCNSYRIKPEPKYRPFKNQEECWQEMQKHQPFGWLKLKCEDTAYGMLTLIKDKGAAVGIDDTPFSYRYLFYNYTFVDRRPFGIKEEV